MSLSHPLLCSEDIEANTSLSSGWSTAPYLPSATRSHAGILLYCVRKGRVEGRPQPWAGPGRKGTEDLRRDGAAVKPQEGKALGRGCSVNVC